MYNNIMMTINHLEYLSMVLETKDLVSLSVLKNKSKSDIIKDLLEVELYFGCEVFEIDNDHIGVTQKGKELLMHFKNAFHHVKVISD